MLAVALPALITLPWQLERQKDTLIMISAAKGVLLQIGEAVLRSPLMRLTGVCARVFVRVRALWTRLAPHVRVKRS